MTTISISDTADAALAGINATNGATVSVVVGVKAPTTGYAVSLPNYTRTIDLSTVRPDLKAATIWAEVAEYATNDHLTRPGFYLGAWLDGDRLVLDVTQVVDSLAAAVSLGQLHDQEAIYNLGEHVEIWLTPKPISDVHPDQLTAWELLDNLAGGENDELAVLVHKAELASTGDSNDDEIEALQAALDHALRLLNREDLRA